MDSFIVFIQGSIRLADIENIKTRTLASFSVTVPVMYLLDIEIEGR